MGDKDTGEASLGNRRRLAQRRLRRNHRVEQRQSQRHARTAAEMSAAGMCFFVENIASGLLSIPDRQRGPLSTVFPNHNGVLQRFDEEGARTLLMNMRVRTADRHYSKRSHTSLS